jgi:hypothetical protein
VSSVEVFQEADGRWRWSFADDKVELKSNRTYENRDSAIGAARTAYPDHFAVQTVRKPHGSGGLVSKIARVLAIVLLIVAWRRSNKKSE